MLGAIAPALRADGLWFAVDSVPLVQAVSLTVEQGEVLMIVGPNGAGKSTLLKLLAGDLVPQTGRVSLFGRDLAELPDREQARCRAVLGQRLHVSLPFTGMEVTLMGRHPHLGGRGESLSDVALASAALERVEASAFADRRFPTLSGGEQMRVGLAKTLAQQAPLMLLDEPTTALDLRHQVAVAQLLKDLASEGCAVVAVVHDLNLAAMAATRIGLLACGSLVAHGSPAEVLRPEIIHQVYGVTVHVQPHPTLGVPHVIVLTGCPDSGPIRTNQLMETPHAILPA